MSHVAYRFYDFELPYHVPWFCVGMAVSKFKQIGVWHKLPHALKEKTKRAQGSWSGVKITRRIWMQFQMMLGKPWRSRWVWHGDTPPRQSTMTASTRGRTPPWRLARRAREMLLARDTLHELRSTNTGNRR